SYFIVPYKVNDAEIIIVDSDVTAFLKMLYFTTTTIFAICFFVFIRIFKNKNYLIFSLVFLIMSLIFLCKMFLYFDKFIEN
ncbi:MAG: hypothetical protein ABI892_03575, partial [Flavobacterium sp.]